jgi:hypothetical protein
MNGIVSPLQNTAVTATVDLYLGLKQHNSLTVVCTMDHFNDLFCLDWIITVAVPKRLANISPKTPYFFCKTIFNHFIF